MAENIIPKIIFLLILSLFFPVASHAFQYPSLPSDNLIQNPWFRGSNCQFSASFWNLTDGQAPWGGGEKPQDPTDINCGGDWTGFTARFARDTIQDAIQEFYPNKDALLSQIVGPVSPADKTLYFHFLFVAHRFNQFKAEIYGSQDVNGPWTLVWTPLNIQNCLSFDCANSPFNQYCMDTRECLWDLVTEAYLGSLEPLSKTVSQGYPYYKIEFLANYPEPDTSTTGDVGVKVTRVYFKVSNEAIPSTPPSLSPSPSTNPSLSPTIRTKPSPTGMEIPGDANNDSKVDGLDYTIWLNNYNQKVTGAAHGDFNGNGIVDGLDYVIWLNNYNQ